MVTQVDAGQRQPQEVGGQRFDDPHAFRFHPASQAGPQKRLGADPVNQQPAGHAATGGPDQRLGYPRAALVGQENVEHQVAMPLRLGDVVRE